MWAKFAFPRSPRCGKYAGANTKPWPRRRRRRPGSHASDGSTQTRATSARPKPPSCWEKSVASARVVSQRRRAASWVCSPGGAERTQWGRRHDGKVQAGMGPSWYLQTGMTQRTLLVGQKEAVPNRDSTKSGVGFSIYRLKWAIMVFTDWDDPASTFGRSEGGCCAVA